MLGKVSRSAVTLGLVFSAVVGTLGCTLDTQGAGASGFSGGSGGDTLDGGSGAAGAAAATAGGSGGSSATGGSGGSLGGSGGSSGGAAGAGGSGGSAATGSEDCLDGVDNDGDNLIDCADLDDCGAGFTCVDVAPTSWEGYFNVRGQAYDPAAPPGSTCPDGGDPTRYFDRIAGPAECPACQCNSPSCTAQPLICFGSRNCGGTAADYSGQVGTSCIDGGFYGDFSCRLEAAQVVAGSCAPVDPAPTLTNTQPFAGITDVCGQATPGGGGCAGGQACIPRATGDYAGYTCVRQSGEQACPVGWGLQIVAHSGVDDQRACTACSCDAAGVTCNLGSYRTWDDDGCRTCTLCSDPRDVNSTSCVDLTGLLDSNTWSMRRTAEATASAACAASGGQPTGTIQGQGTVTFCCQ